MSSLSVSPLGAITASSTCPMPSEFLRADTHRGWGIASMARAAAR